MGPFPRELTGDNNVTLVTFGFKGRSASLQGVDPDREVGAALEVPDVGEDGQDGEEDGEDHGGKGQGDGQGRSRWVPLPCPPRHAGRGLENWHPLA